MLVKQKRLVQLEVLMDERTSFLDRPNIYPMQDGHAVARSSDFIIYSVEAEFIDKVVAQYGPCKPEISLPFICRQPFTFPLLATKMHAVVAGQTSVKAPEKAAFEKHLPEDVHIVSCHSLHGPTVSPLDQPLVSLILRTTYYKTEIENQQGNHPTSCIGSSATTG